MFNNISRCYWDYWCGSRLQGKFRWLPADSKWSDSTAFLSLVRCKLLLISVFTMPTH